MPIAVAAQRVLSLFFLYHDLTNDIHLSRLLISKGKRTPQFYEQTDYFKSRESIGHYRHWY